MNSWNRFALVALFASGVASAQGNKKSSTAAPAPAPTTTTTSSESSYSAPASKKEWAVGYKRIYTVSGSKLSAMNVQVGLTPRMFLGLNFGFDDDFDAVGIGAEFRYNVLAYSNHALYVEGQAAFLKIAGAKLGLVNALVGIDMKLYEHISAQMGVGLRIAFGNVTNHVALPGGAGDFIGDFGVRWTF